MSMTLEQAKEKLAKYGQEHVLKYYGELNEEEKQGILDQIETTDMSILEACKHKEDLAKKGVITPLAAMQLDEIEANREEFTATGIEAIRQGKVAAVLLAGGMGTRLGSDNPKGMYNVGLTHELYIFECLINNLMEVVHQADSCPSGGSYPVPDSRICSRWEPPASPVLRSHPDTGSSSLRYAGASSLP